VSGWGVAYLRCAAYRTVMNKPKEQRICRVCRADFFEQPIFELKGMPAAAQNFPDESELQRDEGVDLTLCQCRGCGLVQLSNQPVDYYRDVIRASAFSEEMREFRRVQFAELVDCHGLYGKKILELGCGRGEYLTLMQEADVQAFGLEHLKSSVKYCQDLGLSVSEGYPDQVGMHLPGAPFDAFFILNFFEHLPDPNTALQIMADNLSEEGIGLIEVPNFDAILEKKLFSEFINDHLFYFTRETLTSTLNANGLELISCESIWYDYILSATVRKRKRLDLDALGDYRTKIVKDIDAYLANHQNRKCAVWGAGHQALSVMALAELADRIDLVVDSAPFKQNKYTPATHIPIKDPSALGDEKVDVVIVMAAAYSDEVVRLIEERFPVESSSVKHVAVLRDDGLEVVRG
jgi:SAM-dependent methyltransferase